MNFNFKLYQKVKGIVEGKNVKEDVEGIDVPPSQVTPPAPEDTDTTRGAPETEEELKLEFGKVEDTWLYFVKNKDGRFIVDAEGNVKFKDADNKEADDYNFVLDAAQALDVAELSFTIIQKYIVPKADEGDQPEKLEDTPKAEQEDTEPTKEEVPAGEDEEPENEEQKESSIENEARGRGVCGGKRKFDGSGRGKLARKQPKNKYESKGIGMIDPTRIQKVVEAKGKTLKTITVNESSGVYYVEIEERLSKIVAVAANSSDEAVAAVEERYKDESVVLGPDNFQDFEIKAMPDDYSPTGEEENISVPTHDENLRDESKKTK